MDRPQRARRLLTGDLAGLYVSGIRGRWWLAPAAAVVGGLVAFALAGRETPTFAATAMAVVAPAPDVSEPADVLRSLETLERRTLVATFARMASTREARARAASMLGSDVANLNRYRVNASVISSTNLLRVRVEGPDPALAAALADASVAVVEENARRHYRLFDIEQVEAAAVPSRPIHPDPARSVAVAAFLGLLVGGLAAALSGTLSTAETVGRDEQG